MVSAHHVDAYDEFEAAVERRRDAARRRAGRHGRKRQEARKAAELREKAAERAATLAMRSLDAECKAVERAWRASDALKAYEKQQQTYKQSATLRCVATTAGLGEATPGLRGPQRLKELKTRVESYHDRVELAKTAAQHINVAKGAHATKREQIAGASRVWWSDKLEAALVGQNCVAIIHMLENGADPDQEGWNCMTPLLCCIAQRRHDLVRRCLEIGSDPNFETTDGKTALLVSIVADDMVAMQMLLESRWKCAPWNEARRGGGTALLVACAKGRLAAVHVLLAQPGSISQIIKGNKAHGLTPLMEAAKANQLVVARLLLRHNANPFVHCKANRSAADYARLYGHLRMERLVARGNDLNLDPSTPPTFDERNEVAALETLQLDLDRCLSDRSMERVMACLQCDGLVSPNHESPAGHMTFLLGCANGDLDTVQLLMPRCLWTHPNRDGVTGLMEAAAHGHFDIVLHLVSHGGDLNQRDLHGHDAFQRLHDGGHHDMLQYLVKYTAKPTNNNTHDAFLPWWQLNPVPRTTAASSPVRSPSKPQLNPLPTPPAVHPRPLCTHCQDRHASKQCQSCREVFCDQCYWRIHMDARRRHHEYTMLSPVPSDTCPSEDHFDGWQQLHLLLTRKRERSTNQELQAIRKEYHQNQDKLHVAAIEADASAQAIHADGAALQLAAVYRDLGKFDQALALLNETEPATPDPLLTWQYRRIAAQVHMAQGKPTDAAASYVAAFAARLQVVAIDHPDILELLDEFYAAMDKATLVDEAVVMARRVGEMAQRTLPRHSAFAATATATLDSLLLRQENRNMMAEDTRPLHDSDKAPVEAMCLALLRDASMAKAVTAFCKQQHVAKTLRLWRDIQTFKTVVRPSQAARDAANRMVKAFPTVHCIPATMYAKVVAALNAAQWSNPDDLLAPCERVVVASLCQTVYTPFVHTEAGQSWAAKQPRPSNSSILDFISTKALAN